MGRRDSLSSTERLLDLIREESPSAPASPPERPGTPPVTRRIATLLSDSLSFSKKTVSIGVDLGHEDLKLVKVHRLSDRKAELLDLKRIPFRQDVPREHPGFPQFLRSALTEFCGNHRGLEIWAAVSSARVETRHLRIPKAPSKQTANAVFWSFQRSSAFDPKETIFDFEILGEVEEAGVKKTAVMAVTAPRKEVEELRDLFARAGFPLTGISIIPFAIQTLLRAERIRSNGAAVASLYVGRDWSRIDVFREDSLVLSRGIKAGIRTMTEALQKEIEQNLFEISLAQSPTEDPNRIRAIRQRLRKEVESARGIFFQPPHDETPGEPPAAPALKEEKIFQMLLPALERLVRQIERTIRHFALNFDNERVEKLFISSGAQLHPRVIDYIGDELGMATETLNPFAADANFGMLTQLPASVYEQSAFAPSMGMALANNALTPNFLFTHKEKGRVASATRLNRSMLAFFIAAIIACLGLSYWQEQNLRQRESEKRALQAQLESFEVRIDRNLILKLVDQIRSRNQGMEGAGNQYLGLALLGEISQITPPQIRLTSLRAKLAPPRAGAGSKTEPPRRVFLEGVVFGDRLNLESELAGYLMTLKGSKLFQQATISRKAFEAMENQTVLRFTAQMDLT